MMVLLFRQLSLPPLDPPLSASSLLYRGVLMHETIFLVHHHYRISSNKQRHLPYPICNRQWLLHLLVGAVPLISIFFLCCQTTTSLSVAYQTTSAKPLAASRPWTTPSQLLSLLQQLLPLLSGHLCCTCYCHRPALLPPLPQQSPQIVDPIAAFIMLNGHSRGPLLPPPLLHEASHPYSRSSAPSRRHPPHPLSPCLPRLLPLPLRNPLDPSVTYSSPSSRSGPLSRKPPAL
ncbi:hypothetical protein BHE74_00047494 [Ensete ventricosum]|nr:hypothetical protein BHE74_00047494 [Ensete ventricosum]